MPRRTHPDDPGGGVGYVTMMQSGNPWIGARRELFKIGHLAFFVYGFLKNERQNIGADELAGFKKLASVMLAYDAGILATVLKEGALIEVICDEEAV